MKRTIASSLALGLISALLSCGSGTDALRANASAPPPGSADMGGETAGAPYRDSALPPEIRAEDLLARMTLEEKAGQMMQVARDYIREVSVIGRYGFGSLLSGGGSGPARNEASSWADMIDGYQAAALKSRLAIPLLYGIDAVHGNNNVRGATIFPHNIGLGAAGDEGLVRDIARATAEEMRAIGARWNFAPCLAVPRDERWGRTYEGFGEDPSIVSRLGAAAVEGYQEGGLGAPSAVIATVKHFAGDGGTAGGKDRGDAVYSDTEFRALFVKPYEAAIKAGAGSVMVSFNSWNGKKDHGNAALVTGILKGELGFKGIVVSDWAGIKELPGSPRDQVREGVNAGIDMVMIPDDYESFRSNLLDLVGSGEVKMERIDDAVRRILTVKFASGLFEKPFASRDLLPSVGSAAHREIARKAVAESLVLLKNSGVLPIRPDASRILVVGPKADDMGVQCGGWTISWQGMSGPITPGTTIRGGIEEVAGAGRTVKYSPDGSLPAGFVPDLVVAVLGEEPYAEMMGDRSDLALGARDESVLRKAEAIGKPVVVLLISGRPMIVTEELDSADAFLACWLPGTEGGGVADILFGKVAPKGKLAYTWPATMADIPINEGDGRKGLFPHGFGLGY